MNWGLPLRRDRDLDGLVDELQLLGLQALSGPSAPVVLLRLVCRSCNLVRELHLMSLHSDTRVEDETVDCSGALCCEELDLVLELVLYGCVVIFSSFCRRPACTAGSFHPPWIRSSRPQWVRSSRPAVGLLSPFHALWVRSLHSLGHPPRRSGPQSFIASFWTSACVFWLFVAGSSRSCFSESAGFTQVLVVVGAAAAA